MGRGDPVGRGTARRRAVLVAFAGLALAAPAAGPLVAQAPPEYRFRLDRVPYGTVWHYVRSTWDGSSPHRVTQYMVAQDRVAVLTEPPDGGPPTLAIARLDWERYGAAEYEAWTLAADGTRRPVPGWQAPDGAALPVHPLALDLATLNAALPQLRRPKAPFTILLAGAPATPRGGGAVTVTYLRDEARDGRPCRVYRLSGPGLDAGDGTMWVDRKLGALRAVEIPVLGGAGQLSYRLALERVERMGPAGWDAFVRGRAGEHH